jgi:hypothetical protein
VVWCDRNHEFAIAENVTTTPDGSMIFAGWWLNNMRFATYASAGLEIPVWRYSVATPWTMPVSASDTKFAGTGSGLPAYTWNPDTPPPAEIYEIEPGYIGGGLSFSGDGSLLAIVSAAGTNDGILAIYDVATQDTIFTRHFVPTQGLYGVDVSVDGSVVVVSNYGQLYVYEIPSGDFRGALYNYSQGIAKISVDGSRIVNGTFSGSVYLYQWDGNVYGAHWIRSTGHDWVTAVDISDDGTTVACGTFDFDGQEIAGGKFELWDAESGTELIDYGEYGDLVTSVALSATGQYAIVGCWGQLGGTFGDVVSCFMRDSDIPIFQLADDLDEPGSIFGVAISDGGHYAAAGGKAVHAREFGNGGMLYSIKIRDPLANDVAVAAIDEPGEFLAPGEAATPTATFINVGLQPATFATACTVTNLQNEQVIYSNTYTVTDLGSFQTSQVFYAQFTMPGEGRYRMKFSAYMSDDQDPVNNDLALVLRSWHDLRALTSESPFGDVTVNWPITPSLTIKNNGSYTETIDITLSILDTAGTEVFAALSTLFNLAPYAVEEIDFENWVPLATGFYQAVFSAMVEGDVTPDDNILTTDFRAVYEMIYDDGISDATFWVGPYPSSTNRMFAQRFEPNLNPPFTITNARFFQPSITYDGSFDYILFTNEMDGFPDTLTYLHKIDAPELPGPDNWASFDVSRSVYTNNPLWVIIHWLDSEASGPYIGADYSGQMDQQSYWFDDANGWRHFTGADWMIRMTISPGIGVESDYFSGLPERISLSQNYPNPFNPSTNLHFGLPNSGQARIEIFDMMGRQVRMLIDGYFEAGYHSARWDGLCEDGSDAGSGVYYYRLSSNDLRVTKKMILVR